MAVNWWFWSQLTSKNQIWKKTDFSFLGLLQGPTLIGPWEIVFNFWSIVCFPPKLKYRGASLWFTFISYESSTFGAKYGIKCGAIGNILWNGLRTSLFFYWLNFAKKQNQKFKILEWSDFGGFNHQKWEKKRVKIARSLYLVLSL